MNLHHGKKKYVVAFVAILALNGFSQNSVTFNVSGAKAVVGNEVFGLLMERLGRQWGGQGSIFVGTNSSIKNTNGMRQDVIDGFIEAGVGAAEWPGGCAGNGYNWSTNKNPSNDVGVDRFIQFCKLTGAEAVIAGKATGSDAASNEAFAKYIINDLNYPLKWFKVGNEVWGCGGSQSQATYTSGYTSNYSRLKALKDLPNGKDFKVIIAAATMEGNYNWIPSYYSSIGNQMDAIEYHDYIYYPDNVSSANPTTANYWTIMNDVFVKDFHGHLYNNIMPAMKAADPSNRVKIDFDEWGDWLMDTGDGWMQDITVMDAVSAAGHLHQFIQNADIVGVACLAQGVNVIHSIININTSGVMVKTPVFYVFKMYKPHHANGAKFCPITTSKFENANGSVPAVNVAATVDNSETVNISFVNVDLTATRKTTVTLTSSHKEYKVLSAEVVTGDQYTSKNAFGGAESVNIKPLDASSYSISGTTLTVTLPSKSVSMIRLQPTDVGTIKPIETINEKAFSVRAGSNGSILISTSEKQKAPVAISLFAADGKTLIANASKILGTEHFSIGNNLSRGAYLVKINGANINLKRLVIIAN